MSPEAHASDPELKFIKRILDFEPAAADFAAAVIAGLSAHPKSIPPKFFYDARGSDIFNRICATEEYYVTRTEVALLAEIGADIAKHAGPGVSVIEYGCGSSDKIRSLLDCLDSPAEYWGIDISRDHLLRSADAIGRDYPGVAVHAVCADFASPLQLPGDMGGRRLAFFPGSTIGNQTPKEAEVFLAGVRRVVGEDGGLLIGVDLRKDLDRLNRAYNDDAGHTADSISTYCTACAPSWAPRLTRMDSSTGPSSTKRKAASKCTWPPKARKPSASEPGNLPLPMAKPSIRKTPTNTTSPDSRRWRRAPGSKRCNAGPTGRACSPSIS